MNWEMTDFFFSFEQKNEKRESGQRGGCVCVGEIEVIFGLFERRISIRRELQKYQFF